MGDTVAERGPIMANRTLSLVSRMFNFAVGRDLCETNPALRVEKPGKEVTKDRVLSDAEILEFWHLVESPRISVQVRQALRLVLITAQRPGEVCKLHREQLDAGTDWWEIPPDIAKNEQRHRVPLSPLAKEVLMELPRISDFVFCYRGDKPVGRWALSQAIQKVDALAKIGFTPHDLRRTAATGMARLGVANHIIARILNHKERSVTGIYNRYEYDPEKKEALNLWGRHLRMLLRGQGKVAPPAATRGPFVGEEPPKLQ